MVLMQFSEPSHVAKLLEGRKRQTTRKARKRNLKVGDVLQCYYKPRMQRGTCKNCISQRTAECTYHEMNETVDCCLKWNNYFGEATVAKIENVVFAEQSAQCRIAWARADGFLHFVEADHWFAAHYGNDWQFMEWQVIHFVPHWVTP